MNKAILVALREYMENLRTKAFWIGILAMPVILLACFGLPVLLQKEKDVRNYAVYDPTGEFLQAVEERSDLPDMEKVVRDSFEKYKDRRREEEKRSKSEKEKEKGKHTFDDLPDKLREFIAKVNGDIEQRILNAGLAVGSTENEDSETRKEKAKIEKETLDFYTMIISSLSKPEDFSWIHGQAVAGGSSEESWAKLNEGFLEPIRKWWRELPPKEAEKYAASTAKSRYHRAKDIDLSESDPEKTLAALVNDGTLFAYFVINPDPVAGSEGCKYVSNNFTDDDLKNWFTRYAADEVRSRLIKKAKIDPNDAKRLQSPIRFESKQISETGEEEDVKTTDIASQWAPVAFVYLLWLSVFMIAQALMTNTIEEKSNKIMEVLLSSVSPIQLMAGKIIGIAGTGLTMIGSWIIFFLIALKFLPLLFGQGPEIDFSLIIRDPIYLTSFIGYFILGYLLLSAILVGIGSVCNSLKEAQNLMMPVTLILIVPLIAMVPIGKDPNGMIAKVLSYIPPFTPFVMMNRAAGPPSTMEYVITTILLIVSIAVALWAAAKVFRVGILMTGKPPRVSEILRWIRAPVGQVHDEGRE